MKNIVLIMSILFSLYGGDYYYEYGKRVELFKVTQARAQNSNVTYYETASGSSVGLKNEVIFKCGVDIDCREVVAKYNFTSISKLSDTLYLVKLLNGEDVFEISQKLHKEKDIEFAQPNLVKKRYRR